MNEMENARDSKCVRVKGRPNKRVRGQEFGKNKQKRKKKQR